MHADCQVFHKALQSWNFFALQFYLKVQEPPIETKEGSNGHKLLHQHNLAICAIQKLTALLSAFFPLHTEGSQYLHRNEEYNRILEPHQLQLAIQRRSTKPKNCLTSSIIPLLCFLQIFR